MGLNLSIYIKVLSGAEVLYNNFNGYQEYFRSCCWLMELESSTVNLPRETRNYKNLAKMIYTVYRIIQDEEALGNARFQAALSGYNRDQNPGRTKRRF